MCGRFYLDAPDEMVMTHFGLEGGIHLAPRYNIAPSQDIAIVRAGSHGREMVLARWGLVPAWSKQEKTRYSMINARAETIADKPAYRQAFRRHRCLVPASGFYEWRKLAGGKQPYRIGMADRSVMALAGLWERWEGDGRSLDSCTIIVTDSNELIRPIHDRMPVMLEPDQFEQWLDPENTDTVALQGMLKPYARAGMSAWPVSRRVNNPDNDDPACMQPQPDDADGVLREDA